VAMALLTPVGLPLFDRFLQCFAVPPDREVDERGGAAEQSGAAYMGWRRTEIVVARALPLTVHMRVDPAGDHDLSGSIDNMVSSGLQCTSGSNCLDLFTADTDIACRYRIRGHDLVTANHEIEHRSLLRAGAGRLGNLRPFVYFAFYERAHPF